MPDLVGRLKSALGDTYRIERELGGGGMSRVFLAQETELGRQVVIKVLPPEMSAGVNIDRFRREIQLAARLQHPHVVPLLTAGSHGDLLWYVMPFIEGESLRAKLAREGELPIGEAARILRDVADALAYAHEHGVVHRDVKPDNVLLTGNHAVVTDFGVAKAVSESSGGDTLTSVGVALGTPAYMSPEQAAANPTIDHRADVYALGAMAYEMLTGRPPFTSGTPQGVLAAHVTQDPDPVTAHRDTVPVALAELVMRCLAKKPADRWQHVEELRVQFESMATPSGGMTPTGTQPVAAVEHHEAARRAHPVRVAALYALASVGVVALVYATMNFIGLPSWVLSGAIAVLAFGLPAMLLTGHHERKRALARTTGAMLETPTGIAGWFRWRRTIAGAGAALTALVIAATAWAGMRTFGIGPAATLVSSNALTEGALVVLADFSDNTDAGISETVTEALRIDLAQTSTVELMSLSDVVEVLERMERDPTLPLEPSLAREIAIREGAEAIVVGEINPAGAGYVLSATVVGAGDGTDLTGVRATASDDGQIISAIESLSRQLRERTGESLRNLRASPRLSRATTSSLDALRNFTEGNRTMWMTGDLDAALPFYERAVEIDTTFAEAWDRIGTYLSNEGREPARVDEAMTRAFTLRSRLPDAQQYYIAGKYHWLVTGDLDEAIDAYEALVSLDPDHLNGYNNLAVMYRGVRRYSDAARMSREAIDRGGTGSFMFAGLIQAQVALGEFQEASRTIDQLEELLPADNPAPSYHRAHIAFDTGSVSETRRHITELRGRLASNQAVQANTSWWLARLAEFEGKLTEAERHEREAMRTFERQGRGRPYFFAAERIAWMHLALQGDTARALGEIEGALERFPFDSLAPADRPYLNLVRFYAHAGQPARAQAAWSAYRSQVPETVQARNRGFAAAEAVIAQTRGQLEQSLLGFHSSDARYWSERRSAIALASTFDRLGAADSAIHYFRKYDATLRYNRINVDAFWQPQVHKRLGELYEARGERDDAIAYYSRFVDRWQDADPELQPVVGDVRQRIAALVAER